MDLRWFNFIVRAFYSVMVVTLAWVTWPNGTAGWLTAGFWYWALQLEQDGRRIDNRSSERMLDRFIEHFRKLLQEERNNHGQEKNKKEGSEE